MNLEELIFDKLNEIAELAGRVYPHAPKEETVLPMAVFTVDGIESGLTLTGTIGVTTFTVTVHVWALDFTEARTISNAVRTGLHGWTDRPNGLLVCGLDSGSVESDDQYWHHAYTFRLITRN